MKKLNLILGLFFVFTTLYSQEISNQLVSPGGQTSKTSHINFDWSLGQIASTTINTSGGLITQGFQQPTITKKGATYPVTVSSSPIIDAWPNPTNSQLFIDIQTKNNDKLNFDIMNNHGIKRLDYSQESSESRITLNLEKLLPGLYILLIHDSSGELIDLKKIIRSN